MNADLFATVGSPRVDIDALEAAIRALGRVHEAPRFWTAIADDARFSAAHRRRVVFALFRRHVHPPTTLGALGAMLDRPRWLSPDSIEPVSHLGGEVPVTYNGQDAVFALVPFPQQPDPDRRRWTIYLRVQGPFTGPALFQALSGAGAPADSLRRPLLEIGLSPEWPS
jgi:hypothetical protein